jgi:broad specificity phosphatase PhoE
MGRKIVGASLPPVSYSAPGLHRIHLVRHGEVHNPRHVVYADLPGYGLSDLGSRQAAAAADHLSAASVAAVVSSPLDRAVATAREIATRHKLPVEIDERLTEWRLGKRWAGLIWEDLPKERPGELEAYLATPEIIDFAAESLSDLAARMLEAMSYWADRAESSVLVSHQDPVQAARRIATDAGFGAFHENKPGHASVTTLARPAGTDRMLEVAYWEPDQGHEFPPVGEAGLPGS